MPRKRPDDGARRYGSHIRRPMNAGALDITAEAGIGARGGVLGCSSPSSHVPTLTKTSAQR